jgi:hypothetical protein
MGWGVGVFFHWLQISERFGLFGSKWEKEQVEKRLGLIRAEGRPALKF